MTNSKKFVDTSAIVQVLGNLFVNSSLFDETEKYNLKESDFVENFHKDLFATFFNLHVLGVKNITVTTVEDYLKEYPTKMAVYKANNGDKYLRKLVEVVQQDAFNFYYQRVKKFTLLRKYSELGLNLDFIYDPDEMSAKKMGEQESRLNNLSIVEIADMVDNKIEEIKIQYAQEFDEDFISTGVSAYDLLLSLKETPDLGVPMYGKFMNTIHRGARLKKFYIRSAASGVGKAIPNDTIIPTPTGNKRVDEIKVGDYLFDGFGKPTKVIGAFPQGEKDVWEITFKDGRKAKCCDEHLWSFCTIGQSAESKKNRKFHTETLKDIVGKRKVKTNDLGYRILVPINKPVQYTKKEYYIKPYSFGLMLGDGSFRYAKNQKAFTYSSEDEELPNAIAKEMNWNVKKNSEHNYSWVFEWKKDSENSHKNVWVEEVLRDYPSLWNVKSEDKYIPKEYLEGSVEQRYDLLNGLLDSDGSVDKEKARVSFCTISSKLKNDVTTLAQSLGFKVTVSEDRHKDSSTCYILHITGNPENKMKLFKLKRKKDIVEDWYNNEKRKEKNDFNPIVSIENLNYKTEMTCFLVDNEEHLFLMNDFIVTHNTRYMTADACYIACEEIYDLNKNEWIKTNKAEKTLFISTELDQTEITTMQLAFISGVDEEKILKGNYTEEEWERVVHACDVLNQSGLICKLLPDFSATDIENTIKQAVINHGVRYVFFDYLHSTSKMLAEISGASGIKGMREDNVLFLLSVKLKDLCNEYGIFIMTSTQLNGGWKNVDVYDQNLLRGAKSIADKCDYGSIMVDVTEEDRDFVAPIVAKKRCPYPNVKLAVYKNRGGKYKDVLVWISAQKGISRFDPLFVTNYAGEVLDIEDTIIEVF